MNRPRGHKGAKHVSVVIPVYNEEGSLEELTRRIFEVLGDDDFEIIFVDDGSRDNSRAIMQRLAAEDSRIRLIRFLRNFGKSAALAAGFEESRGDIVITMDADLQDDPAMIPNFLATIESGYDLVSGWKVHRHDPPSKTVPSRLFNLVTAKATGVKLHDFNCGFKAYRRELVDKLSIYGELHRFIPALAHWKGFEVAEIPVEHHPRLHGKSKFGTRRFLSGLLDLATVLFLTRFNRKPLHLFGSVGLLSVMAGLLINVYLTVLRIQGETIGNRPLLMLGVLLMIIGLQFFGIGLLADLSNLTSSRRADLDHHYEVWPVPTKPVVRRATRPKRPARTAPEQTLS